jgi:hypothetical protein
MDCNWAIDGEVFIDCFSAFNLDHSSSQQQGQWQTPSRRLIDQLKQTLKQSREFFDALRPRFAAYPELKRVIAALLDAGAFLVHQSCLHTRGDPGHFGDWRGHPGDRHWPAKRAFALGGRFTEGVNDATKQMARDVRLRLQMGASEDECAEDALLVLALRHFVVRARHHGNFGFERVTHSSEDGDVDLQ